MDIYSNKNILRGNNVFLERSFFNGEKVMALSICFSNNSRGQLPIKYFDSLEFFKIFKTNAEEANCKIVDNGHLRNALLLPGEENNNEYSIGLHANKASNNVAFFLSPNKEIYEKQLPVVINLLKKSFEEANEVLLNQGSSKCSAALRKIYKELSQFDKKNYFNSTSMTCSGFVGMEGIVKVLFIITAAIFHYAEIRSAVMSAGVDNAFKKYQHTTVHLTPFAYLFLLVIPVILLIVSITSYRSLKVETWFIKSETIAMKVAVLFVALATLFSISILFTPLV